VVGNGYGYSLIQTKPLPSARREKSLREIGKTHCDIMALLADDSWGGGANSEERKKFALLIYLSLFYVSRWQFLKIYRDIFIFIYKLALGNCFKFFIQLVIILPLLLFIFYLFRHLLY
jgi:hypothetical protein